MQVFAAKMVNRAAALSGSYGNTRRPPERVDAEAAAALTVELVNQELDLFARFCYRTTHQGHFLHIKATGQIRNGVWAPWGASGKSSLTRQERDTLRLWLIQLDQQRKQPLWVYNEQHRRWFVNLHRYPVQEAALFWLSRHPVTPQAWLDLLI
jgi:hypothetical protein